MIGAAGSVGAAVKREDDHAYRSAVRSKNGIVRLYYSIGVVDQILCIFGSRLSQCGIDIDRHSPTRTSADEFRVAAVTGPFRRLWTGPTHCSLPHDNCSGSDAVTHFRSLLASSSYTA